MTRFEIRIPLGGAGRSYPAWLEWFGRVVPYRFRRIHHWYATVAGFFWMPCALCDQEFGGHEWRNIGGKPSSVPDPTQPPPGPNGPFTSVGICPTCTRAGRGVPFAWSPDADR